MRPETPRFGTPSRLAAALLLLLGTAACAARGGARTTFHDEAMDFSLVRTVAVLPFANLTANNAAAERVRDVFIAALQAEGTLYVLPPGEVARGLARAPIAIPSTPSAEEVVGFAKAVSADSIVTATLLEYGEARSGSATANFISVSAKMIEAQTGRVVWSAVVTKGGIGPGERLFGGGGKPMNDVTLEAVQELIDRLMR